MQAVAEKQTAPRMTGG